MVAWVGFGMAVSAGETVGAVLLVGLAAVLVALAVQLRRTQPVAYTIEDGALVIERRSGRTRLPGPVEPHVDRVTLGLRLGSGGVYGYRGRFKVSSGGWARALVTDTRRTVLIFVDGRRIVLSPADPAALVQEVRDA